MKELHKRDSRDGDEEQRGGKGPSLQTLATLLLAKGK